MFILRFMWMESQHIFFCIFVTLSLTLMTKDFYKFPTYFLHVCWLIIISFLKQFLKYFTYFLQTFLEFLLLTYRILGCFFFFFYKYIFCWPKNCEYVPQICGLALITFNLPNFCLMDSCFFPNHRYCSHLSELISTWLNTCRGALCNLWSSLSLQLSSLLVCCANFDLL